MVSVLINIIQYEQYFFSFYATSWSSLMSHHRFNIKCNNSNNKSKRTALKIALLIYALLNFYCVIMLRIFRSNHHCSWKFHKFDRKTPVLESCFFLEMMKLYKDICSAWIKVDLHSANVSRANDAIRWRIFFFNLQFACFAIWLVKITNFLSKQNIWFASFARLTFAEWRATFIHAEQISLFNFIISGKRTSTLKCVRQNSFQDLWSNTLQNIWQGVHPSVK